MIVKEHKLIKYEFQSGNVPQYRHYVECSCGWQGRCGTEVAAKDQYDNHLVNHGVTPYFSNLVEPVEEKVTDASPEDITKEGAEAQIPVDNTQVPQTNVVPPQGGLSSLGGGQVKQI